MFVMKLSARNGWDLFKDVIIEYDEDTFWEIVKRNKDYFGSDMIEYVIYNENGIIEEYKRK